MKKLTRILLRTTLNTAACFRGYSLFTLLIQYHGRSHDTVSGNICAPPFGYLNTETTDAKELEFFLKSHDKVGMAGALVLAREEAHLPERDFTQC